MSIKNVTAADLALVELLAGKTEAPAGILTALDAKDYVEFIGGKPRLTPRGKRRAERLKPHEHDMRLMFGAAGDSPLHTVGGCAFTAAQHYRRAA
jgi:hypothetical protein